MVRETDDLADAADVEEDLEDLALDDDYALNPEFVSDVADALDRGDAERLRELLAALHPADVADLMGFLAADAREELIPHLDPETLAEILSELDSEIREEVLEHVPSATLAKAIGEMESDDAADVVDDLEDDKRAEVMAAMPELDRAAIETTLSYGEETAGRLMQREVVAAPQFWTVGHAIDHMRGNPDALPDQFFDIYVVDPAFKPVGAVPLATLLKARREIPLTGLMEPVTEIDVGQDQEEVAYAFQKYGLISAPVTDRSGRLVGQITVDDIVGVLQEENQEDILALAGVGDEGRDASTLGASRSRLPWLAVNLVTALIAASVIGLFADSIEALVALAVLMPIVTSVGGNAGTQALTVTVRALALRELNASNAFRMVRREVKVAVLNGAVLALITGVAAGLWFRDAPLGGVIALAMVLNMAAAGLAGALVPLALDRVEQDPAVSSSVFVTAVTDVFGFFVFLGLATLILLR